MHILFISHYFPPEVNAPANRTYEHARRWAADGHQVTVITGVPNHPKGEIFPGYENKWIQEENRDGIRVIRTWMYLTANEGFLRRTLSYVLFATTAVCASLGAPRPDVVVATSPQFFVGIAGLVVACLKGRPFVLEVRDLWPESIVALGQLRNAHAIRLLEGIETLLYRSAAGIVVLTRTFADHIRARGVAGDRIELIYNGIDPALFSPAPPDQALLAANGLSGRFLVAYVGTLGLAHGLGTLIDTAELLRDRQDMMFLLIGDGADRDRLDQEITRRGLSNVRLLGLRPRAEIPAWLASTDCLLVLLRDLPIFETVIPSKFFEFLAQERAVIVAARGEIRRMAEEAKAALVIDPERSDQLAHAILEVREHPEEARARARTGRLWVEGGFLRDDLARRMERFLVRTVERGS